MKSARQSWEKLEKSAEFLKNRGFSGSNIAVVLGSGLGGLADKIENPVSIESEKIPGYPSSSVEGHQGRIICGTLRTAKVITFQGRVHYYEGYSPLETCAPVMVAQRLGAETIIITNAAGALNPSYSPGELMVIRDILRFNYIDPLRGLQTEMTRGRQTGSKGITREPYMKLAQECANMHGLVLHFGTYAAVQGPSYETPAETKMLSFAGADAVGMSTVPEIILAKKLGLNILPLSCLTNAAAGISSSPLTHQEVQKVADSISGAFVSMMIDLIEKINYFHRW